MTIFLINDNVYPVGNPNAMYVETTQGARAVKIEKGDVFAYSPTSGTITFYLVNKDTDLVITVSGSQVSTALPGPTPSPTLVSSGTSTVTVSTGGNTILAVRCGDGTDEDTDGDDKPAKDDSSR